MEKMVGAFELCVHGCPARCEEICPLPENITIVGGYAVITGATTDARLDDNRQLVNDTSGLCLQECHANCTANCSAEMSIAVEEIWCGAPSEPK